MSQQASHSRVTDASRPKVLLTDSNRWPLGPRLAMGLADLGCDVAVVCPFPGHPAVKTNAVRQTIPYRGNKPLESLKRAIETVDPDIILPLCDRSVHHLHKLHAKSDLQGGAGSRIARLIERSLGTAESFQVVSSRYFLLQAARSAGIRVPEMIAIDSVAELDLWCAHTPSPWVIKAEGSWGGRGVRVANSLKEARRYWMELSKRPSLVELTKRLMLNRGREWILSEWRGPQPNILVQSYVSGRPANCAVVCWRGELLAGIGVEVIQAQGPTEPALVVQVVDGTEMLWAAEVLAKRLNLSGFFGLDFMIEEDTGAAYLIEMNPRCTPPCPMPLGPGRDLVAALCAKLKGQPLIERKPATDKKRITYFPRNWGSSVDRADAIPLETMFYDVPEGEPELVKELLRPWSSRSTLGEILDSMRRVATRNRTSSGHIFQNAIAPVTPDSESVFRT